MVGDPELTDEALGLPAGTGLTMITYTAEPGSAVPDTLRFLGQLGHRAPPVGATMQLTRNSIEAAAGPREAWHTHPNGQTIYVAQGSAWPRAASAR